LHGHHSAAARGGRHHRRVRARTGEGWRCACMKRPAFSDKELNALQHDTFKYFWQETNTDNGLLADNTSGTAPVSIAGVGHALAAYTVGVERGWIKRAEGARRTLTTLRFFWHSPQGAESDATGYKGF